MKKSSATPPPGSQELGPAGSLPAGRGIDAGVLEDPPDRGRRHGDAEPGQIASGNPPTRSPGQVVAPPTGPSSALPGARTGPGATGATTGSG